MFVWVIEVVSSLSNRAALELGAVPIQFIEYMVIADKVFDNLNALNRGVSINNWIKP